MNEKTMQRLEMEMALHTLNENLDVIIEQTKIQAKVRKVKFDALLIEGFNEDQALHIVSVSKPFE